MATQDHKGIPAWAEEFFLHLSKRANTNFILHLNIYDPPDLIGGVVEYLTKVMFSTKTLVDTERTPTHLPVHLDRARGIHFLDEDCECTFRLGIRRAVDEAQANAWAGWLGATPLSYGPMPRQPELGLAMVDDYARNHGTSPMLKERAREGVPSGRLGLQTSGCPKNAKWHRPMPLVLFVHNAPLICPAGDGSSLQLGDRVCVQALLNMSRDNKSDNVIVMMANSLNEVHPYLTSPTSGFHSIALPYPSETERTQWFMRARHKDEKTGEVVKIGKDKAESWGRLSAGLRKRDLACLMAKFQPGLPTDEQFVESKKQIMETEFGGILEPMNPRFGFEYVGGLNHVKLFMRRVITAIKSGAHSQVPVGILCLGPPGTGKSIVAEAVAYEAGINCVILNPARVYSKWVGESERNLEKAIQAIQSLTPCLVFVDELEQAFQRGESGDSGVSNRIFKRVMEFMSNTGNRGRVLFLAASNRPDLMDAALKRPGRFDKKIIFEVPGTPQRADILTVMLRRYAEGFKVKPKEVNELADQTEGWTGAEIELLTTKACELAARNGGPHVVTYPHMQKAMKFIRRSTKQTEFMTAVALLECDDLEYLPASYQANFEERLTWAEKIVAQHRQANRR